MKKGFTLVEMLAVVIVLGILIIITVPAYLDIHKRIQRSTYDAKLSNIRVKALKYGDSIKDEIKNSKDSCLNIKIDDLIESGLMRSEKQDRNVIINPTDGSELQGNIRLCYCMTNYDINAFYTTEFKSDKYYYKNEFVTITTGTKVDIYECIRDYPALGGINGKNSKNEEYFRLVEC